MKKKNLFVGILKWIVNVFLTVLLIGIVSGSIMAVALALYIKGNIDTDYDIDNLKLDLSQTTSIYYMDYTDDEHTQGEWVELETERIHGTENRLWVSYDQIPRDLVDCIVAIEDKRFWTHDGVDWKRTAGAVLHVFKNGSFGYGGSTITQQLIKNVTGDDDVKVQRKIQEIFRALSLEKKKTKEEILEMYLNTIYLSQGCSGVQSAAELYFHKDVSELTLVECACIAGITNRPTYYDPILNPENNKERRQVIFTEMLEQGLLTQEEFDEVYDMDVVLFNGDGGEDEEDIKIHSWFVDTVMDDVIADLMEQYDLDENSATQYVYSGGLKIYTTMDIDVQTAMEEIFSDDESFPKTSEGVQPESAMVVVNPYNGNVLGIVGGRGEKKENRGWNRATMTSRQPGSSIKPLSVYSLGLDAGIINYSTSIDDFPYNINSSTGKAWPSNSPATYRGKTTVADAVIRSVNTVAVRIVDELGTDYVFDMLKSRYRLSTLVAGARNDLNLSPLALGGFTYGVTLRDMATAYATLANNGVYNKSRTYIKVEDAQGNLILSNAEYRDNVISSEAALVMTKILTEVADPYGYGTARGLSLSKKIDVAAKTGTTNDSKDLYFAGYTPYFVGCVWFGYDQPRYMSTEYKTAALDAWDLVMTKIHEKYLTRQEETGEKVKSFDFSTLVEVEYCKDSGLLVSENCKHDPRGDRTATGYFAYNNVPTSECNVHVMVDICDETNSVAGEGCEHTHQVALVKNEDRKLEVNVAVTDAQYTYMEVPEGYKYPDDTSLPFYMNLYIDGTYPGFTMGITRPLNSYCVEHNKENTVSWEELCAEYAEAHKDEDDEDS